jgi:hypothetical protein
MGAYLNFIVIAVVGFGVGSLLTALTSGLILKRRFKKHESKYRKQFRSRKDSTIDSIAAGIFGSSESGSNESSITNLTRPINSGTGQNQSEFGKNPSSVGQNSKFWFINK